MHPLKLGVKLEFISKNDLSSTQNHILLGNQLGTPLKTSFLVPQDYFTRSAYSRRKDSSPLETNKGTTTISKEGCFKGSTQWPFIDNEFS
jgi:hypothetical protein